MKMFAYDYHPYRWGIEYEVIMRETKEEAIEYFRARAHDDFSMDKVVEQDEDGSIFVIYQE
jgi:hypothetical protein